MPTADDQKKLEELQKRRNEELDAIIAAFVASLGALVEQWRESAERLAAQELERLAAQQVFGYVETRLNYELGRSGYQTLCRETLATYSDNVNAVGEQLEAVGAEGAWTAANADRLSALQSLDGMRLERTGATAAQAAAEAVTSSVLTESPVAQRVAALEKILDKFQFSARTIVDTGILGTYRFVYWQRMAGIAAGFLYFGPADDKNRRFCAEHVGKSYTPEQIEKMDNGEGLEVKTWCGGFNCRHSWLAQVGREEGTTP